MASRVVLYAADWCPDCRHVRDWLNEHHIDFAEVDIEKDPEADRLITDRSYGHRVIPTLDVDGHMYLRPRPEELARIFDVEEAKTVVAPVGIIGAGPAGLTAAIYLARERIDTVVLERTIPGGQVITTSVVENYPGFPEGVGGVELMDKLENQARRFGANLVAPAEVTQITRRDGNYELLTPKVCYLVSAVVIAVGSEYRRLDVPGANELTGKGVHYCATCDAPFYRKKTVAVVGGGNSAVDESNFLLDFADRLYVIEARDQLSAQQVAVDELKSHDNVEILLHHQVTQIHTKEEGDGKKSGPAVDHITVKDLRTDQQRDLEVDGVFVFIGQTPNTGFLRGSVELDDRGYVVTKPGSVETDRPGLYVAGDCRAGSKAQITTAVGDATVAAFLVRDYLKERR